MLQVSSQKEEKLCWKLQGSPTHFHGTDSALLENK